MCGRARLPTDYSQIKIQLRLSDFAPAPNLRPSWNVAPTDDMFCVVCDAETGGRFGRIMRWGLIPAWSRDGKLKFPTFNARSETVASTPAFREAWRAGRRCLVVTDGFYEWRKGDRQPFAIACTKGKLTVLAGLWEDWRSPKGETIRTCTVLTTDANALLAPLHDRMPVILAEKDWPQWLGEVPAAEEELRGLLKPFSSEEMQLWPVDRRVGSVKNNDPSLAEPIVLQDPAPQLDLDLVAQRRG
jgi:putative SOS response-associated peptidase YedK